VQQCFAGLGAAVLAVVSFPLEPWGRSYLQAEVGVSPYTFHIVDSPRTKEGVERPLDMPIACGQDRFDDARLDAWKCLPKGILRLFSRAQGPGRLWRGWLGGSWLRSDRGGSNNSGLLGLIVKVHRTRGSR
jgi:hypothetical protein